MASLFTNWEKRKEDLERIAYQLDMKYTEKDEWGLKSLLKGFKLFREGSRRKIFNILEKKDPFLEEQFHIFDYQYTVSSGNSSRTFYQTVFFIQSKKLGLPDFLMKPENFFHKIGAYLGMQDIDFIQHEQFSKQYLLQGDDEELVRRMMHDRMLHYFTIEKNWHLEGVGYFLVIYKKNKLIAPRTVKSMYKKGMTVYKMLEENKG